jgi:hypothetical protein
MNEEPIIREEEKPSTSDRHLQLLPRRKITVWASSGDAERFVDLFQSCWKQLPQKVRRRITEYWKRRAVLDPATGQECGPWIQLSDDWHDSETCFGQVRNCGMEVRFSARAFDELPYRAARWVIAHELAHVYQKTIGRCPGGLNANENERHANGLVKDWGFPRESRFLIDVFIDKLGLEGACRRAADFESISGLDVHTL